MRQVLPYRPHAFIRGLTRRLRDGYTEHDQGPGGVAPPSARHVAQLNALGEAGLDEGLLSLYLPVLVYIENYYSDNTYQWRMTVRPRLYIGRGRAARGAAPAQGRRSARAPGPGRRLADGEPAAAGQARAARGDGPAACCARRARAARGAEQPRQAGLNPSGIDCISQNRACVPMYAICIGGPRAARGFATARAGAWHLALGA
jgi:hypothetical protein